MKSLPYKWAEIINSMFGSWTRSNPLTIPTYRTCSLVTYLRTSLLLPLLFLISYHPVKGQDYKHMRENMVIFQIQARGITHKPTLKAMREIPRHLFVPDDYVSAAYEDGPLPIGYGQTISQPFIVAYMTEIINPKSTDKILEIGTGSGYQAAVLSKIVKKVYTMEIVPELGNQAKKRLADLGYSNVFVRIGDGYNGWKEQAPFDAIIVTAAAEFIPLLLLSN